MQATMIHHANRQKMLQERDLCATFLLDWNDHVRPKTIGKAAKGIVSHFCVVVAWAK
jgi:hypothetical protein